MKRRDLCAQCDMFSSVPIAPTLAVLQQHHEDLVELLSRLLWEVACAAYEVTSTTAENRDEQDQP